MHSASEATLSRTGMNIDLVRYETTETDNMTPKNQALQSDLHI